MRVASERCCLLLAAILLAVRTNAQTPSPFVTTISNPSGVNIGATPLNAPGTTTLWQNSLTGIDNAVRAPPALLFPTFNTEPYVVARLCERNLHPLTSAAPAHRRYAMMAPLPHTASHPARTRVQTFGLSTWKVQCSAGAKPPARSGTPATRTGCPASPGRRSSRRGASSATSRRRAASTTRTSHL